MLPKYHILTGLLLTILIYIASPLIQLPITPLQVTIIFLSSFLIDFDHYFLYILREKNLSLKRATKFFKQKRKIRINMPISERRKHKRFIYIFHGIEFWLLILLLAQFSHLFYFILLGFLIHMILDWIDFIILGDPIIEKFSQSATYLRNKGKLDFI